MKEQIELELNKIRDRWETDDGILDSEYSRLENMIFAEKGNESFPTIMHLLFILKKKVAMENDWQYEQWWNHVTDFVSEKMNDLFSFIENDISADELSTLSEIWERIAKKTQSKPFIFVLHKAIKKFPEESEKYHLEEFLDDAKWEILDWSEKDDKMLKGFV